MSKITLANGIAIANLLCLVTLISVYLTSTKPEEVLEAVRVQNAALSVRADSNSEGINSLRESQAGVLGELTSLQKSLNSLYQSLVTLIEMRTQDDYPLSGAAEDWREFQRNNPGAIIPERFLPK